MKELQRGDLNAIHDILYEITEKEPTDTEIQEAYERLDQDTKLDIERWGACDTVVRDAIFVELFEIYG